MERGRQWSGSLWQMSSEDVNADLRSVRVLGQQKNWSWEICEGLASVARSQPVSGNVRRVRSPRRVQTGPNQVWLMEFCAKEREWCNCREGGEVRLLFRELAQ